MTAESGSELNLSSTAAVAAIAKQPACRKFTLADALILIAGLTIVLSMGAHLLALSASSFLVVCLTGTFHLGDNWAGWPRLWDLVRKPAVDAIWYGFQFAGTLLFGMTPIFFILRLRRPRPRWRALLTQPGVVAAVAMVVGLFWVTWLVHLMFPDRLDTITGPWIAVGGTVAAVWLVLLLCRRWTAEPGWVDAMGRLLGAMAIGTAVLGLVIYRI
jgi:hypothetical protein